MHPSARAIAGSVMYTLIVTLIPSWASADQPDQGLSRLFRTAPEQEAAGTVLLEVTLNGLPAGVLPFILNEGSVVLPAETAHALRIRSTSAEPVDLSKVRSIEYRLDKKAGTIRITAPPSAFATMDILPGAGAASPVMTLSPETWGVFANYDVNARRYFSSTGPQVGYGGFADLRAFAPDFAAASSWS